MVQGLYLVAVEPLRKQFSWADHFDRRRAVLFTCGLLVIALAEGTALHDLSEHFLFSAHMIQHMLIILVAAPLLLAGMPPWLLRPVTTLGFMQPVMRCVTNPIVAGAIFNVVLMAMHVPPIYELALHIHWTHIVQHMILLIASLLFWWPMLSPLPEFPAMSSGGQLLYLFVVKFPQIPLGAFLTFSQVPWYATYVNAPRVWQFVTPVQDQQMAGLIMSVPMSFILFGAMAAIFFVWFGQAEKEEVKVRGR